MADTRAPDEVIQEATSDSSLALDLLPPELSSTAFDELNSGEVEWQTMLHRAGPVPRLIAVQGEVHPDGTIPIYRHPADLSPPLLPFTPTVTIIAKHAERVLNLQRQAHEPPLKLNHVLIQLYRSGEDHITGHSDKTIDVVRGSKIVNVSLGAQRTMILRMKKPEGGQSNDDGTPGPPRASRRIPLPHNSMFILGLRTNRLTTHEIRPDKRLQSLLSPSEVAFSGSRISLTFRSIGTFLSPSLSATPSVSPPPVLIWGQGATSKSKTLAKPVLNGEDGEGEEAKRLLVAFSRENHRMEFDWDVEYGSGSDVLHLNGS